MIPPPFATARQPRPVAVSAVACARRAPLTTAYSPCGPTSLSGELDAVRYSCKPLEQLMSGKSKGGREIRKPKQDKKPKVTEIFAVVPKPGTKKPK